jgi:uncharacterized membrane protein
LLENFDIHAPYHGVSLRLMTVSLTACLVYAAARFGATANGPWGFTFRGVSFEGERIRAAAYSWAATFLLALLAWYELRPAGVAVAWTIGGLVLLELGVSRRALGLRMQAYVLFLASFARIFFVNVNANGGPGEHSPRFYTMLPVMLAFLYGYWRLRESESLSIDRDWKTAETCCYLGVITLVALMRFELAPDWVAAAWASLVLALMAVAWRSGQRIFLHQALLIGVALGFRTSLHNLYERSYFPAPPWESRMITVGAVVLFLFAALPIAFRMRIKGGTSQRGRIGMALEAVARRPEQALFFLAVGLLSALLAIEMRHGMVTLAWGVEGVAIFLMALWLGERSFRLTGLGLLLLCVAKILLVDVWRLNPRDRYLTFIVLGGALLLVSYLYTRNREALRQYL